MENECVHRKKPQTEKPNQDTRRVWVATSISALALQYLQGNMSEVGSVRYTFVLQSLVIEIYFCNETVTKIR